MCFASGQNISVPLVGAFSLSIMPVEVKIVFGCIEPATIAMAFGNLSSLLTSSDHLYQSNGARGCPASNHPRFGNVKGALIIH